MSYTVAGVDVHKKLLVVVAADVSQPEWTFECRRFGTGAGELHDLALWLCDRGAAEVVMESTAQYWKPVWLELEPHMRLHLAQAQSNRAPHGRKSDFGDAKRLLRRFVAGELCLSFVPDAEQRGWRTVTRAPVRTLTQTGGSALTRARREAAGASFPALRFSRQAGQYRALRLRVENRTPQRQVARRGLG
jgi:hypothetical protein